MSHDMSDASAPCDRRTALLAEYAELHGNFRLLTNIRFKLLAVLPLAPAIAAIVTTGSVRSTASSDGRALALSLFGLVVTAALASYNARNDQIYLWHVDRGSAIERELGLADGSFANRPSAWVDFKLWSWRWQVGHVSSVTAIYLASMALWGVIGLSAAARLVWGGSGLSAWAYVGVIIMAVMLVVGGRAYIRRQRTTRSDEMENYARSAIKAAMALTAADRAAPASEACMPFVEACVGLASRERDERDRRKAIYDRMEFYAKEGGFTRALESEQAAAQYVALIVDLPPSWLRKTPQRRRAL
jgi:hypothetical protein